MDVVTESDNRVIDKYLSSLESEVSRCSEIVCELETRLSGVCKEKSPSEKDKGDRENLPKLLDIIDIAVDKLRIQNERLANIIERLAI